MLKSRLLGAVGIVAVVGGIFGVLAAQTPTPLAFEVASIKVNKSGDRASHGVIQPGGRLIDTNVTLLQLIRNAYHLAPEQIIGGPDWIKAEHYDIEAKGPDKPTLDQRASMYQNFIADRFALKIHHETRELAAANLTLARRDGKLGPHLLPATEADSDCASRVPPDFSKPGFAALPPCSTSSATGQNGTGQFRVRGYTMDRLATALAGFHIAPFVFDKTNLEGAFNIDLLEYRPDNLSAVPSPDAIPSASADAPTILTALQEQLGLKVELIKGPVDVIVIDHAEHPTPD